MELNELRKIAEAATPGPWEIDGPAHPGPDDTLALHNNDGGAIAYVQPLWDDAEFIATFDPPTVLALLSRLEQAEQAVARVRVALTEVQGRGERISEMPNTGSIRSQERAARGTGYLEATCLAFRALDGDGRG